MGMDEKAMGNQRILLRKSQIRKMSSELERELMKMLPYDYKGKEDLISRYIGKVQETIRENIISFIRDDSETDGLHIRGRLLQDILEDSPV